MEKYNYLECVISDVRDWFDENRDQLKGLDRYEVAEKLNDELFCNDSVTGNASGSYFFNAWKAEEAICHNFDLLAEACEEFGDDYNPLKQGAEVADVIIRCYLLGQAIEAVLDEVEETGFFECED